MMSPLAATSTPSSIKLDWSDDEILIFLERKRSGDPLSSNVITEVNPFRSDPWNLPDNIWYLCNSKEPISSKADGEIKNTTSGYWKDMECDVNICISNHTVGRKVTWEFFGGGAPSGDKIVWKMFEYKLEKSESQTTDGQEFNSLCRVFWCNKITPAFEEPQNSVNLNDADGDYVQSALLSMLEREEEEIDLLGSTYGSQGLVSICDGSVEDLRPNRSAEFRAECDFSNGDFLELNDLYDPESSSSSSDNSSCVSQSSDEYFDSEALLRVLESESKQVNEGQHAEHSFSVSSSLRSERMVVQPPPPSSIHNSGALVMMREASSASGLGRGPQREGSPSFLLSSGNGGSPRRNQVNKVTDSSSQGAGTSQGSVANRVGRIAKLGKKYFCFASY